MTDFFDDKLCTCGFANFVYRNPIYGPNGYNYNEAQLGRHTTYPDPPKCATCQGWNVAQMHRCHCCKVRFFMWFRHPRMYISVGKVWGWTCWNCVVKHGRKDPKFGWMHKLSKSQPPACVLPPDYELFVPAVIKIDTSAAMARFRERMGG